MFVACLHARGGFLAASNDLSVFHKEVLIFGLSPISKDA